MDNPFARFRRREEPQVKLAEPSDNVVYRRFIKAIRGALGRQTGEPVEGYFPELWNYLRNPDAIGVRQYERMVQTDETVGMGIDLIVLTVLTMLGSYQHPKKRVQTFVQDSLDGLENGNFQTAVAQILTNLWAGYSVSEWVAKADGDRIVPARIVTYSPTTIRFKPDAAGLLSLPDSITQHGTAKARTEPMGLRLPRERTIVAVHNKRFGNWYGQSVLRRAYKNWLIKDHLLKSWARALDRFGTPLLMGYAPDTQVEDPDNPGTKIHAVKLMARVLGEAADSKALAVPNPSHKDDHPTKAEALTTPTAGMGDGFHQAVLYLNKGILRSMLIPSLLADEGQTSGSYSLADAHFSLFEWMIAGIRNAIVEALVEQLITPLVLLNFGPQDGYGTFANREVRLAEKAVLVEVFRALTELGYMTPEEEEDFTYVRQAMGVPSAREGRVGVLQPLKSVSFENSGGGSTISSSGERTAA